MKGPEHEHQAPRPPARRPNTADPAIDIERLSKVYRIYRHPFDRIRELVRRRPLHQPFTALTAIDLRVPKGSTLGIIGENGAGKSTLLQLLCGVLEPTEGAIRTSGKVLGLLELGVGFNQEFTGRDNIFYYGDLLGLDRQQVRRAFEAIVEFSELGTFIDQPLKTYSTGMTMRLAFSLVATLEPEILVVDEALAVGDVYFQKKCIDRMTAIRERGCTILFCSHSTYQVAMFCERTLWLKGGRIEMLGPSLEVISRYEAYQARKEQDLKEQAWAATPARIARLRVHNPLPMRCGDDLTITVEVACERDDLPYHLALSLKMDNGRGIFVTATHFKGMPPLRGRYRRVTMRYPRVPLMGGSYRVHARVFDEEGLVLYHEKARSDLTVLRDSVEMGICRLDNHWSADPAESVELEAE